MNRFFRPLIVILLCATQAFAGTITGFIQTPTGGAVNGATLTFKLSQGAILSGTASITASQVSCYTATNGSVVGLPDPQVPPVLTTSTGAGSLPPSNYFVKLYYTGAGGVSNVSPEASINLSGTGEVFVAAPILQPGSASGYGVAISTTSGTETIQGTITGFGNYTQNVPLITGSAPPSSNTSVCSLAFSDQLIPTGTFYNVNLLNKQGSQIAGYPQTWCLYGGANGTINIASGAPVGNCGSFGVYYPTPIWSNPPSGATTQSLNSGLNMGANPLTVGNITASGSLSLGGALTVAGFTSTAGAVIDVSGNACTMPLQLVNTDATPTNPNKYFRINQSTGALEIVNSACTSTIFSLGDAGDITGINSVTGGHGGTVLLHSPLTINSNGVFGGGSPFAGNSLALTTPSGSSSSVGFGNGGVLSLLMGARCNNASCDTGPFAFGQIVSNTYFGQYNGLNTVGQGVSPEVAAVDAVAQNAAITTTTLYAVPTYTSGAAPTAQEYVLRWNAKVTTAAGSSSTLGALTIVYTDPDGVVQTITTGALTAAGAIATTSAGNSTTTVLLGVPLFLNCKAGTNITYAFAYASNAANAMNYNLHLNLSAY